MVWEAQVVIKGSRMRSRPRSSALHKESPRRDAKERLYALRRRFVAVVDAQGIAIKVLGGFSPWWSTASPQRIVAKKRLVKITGTDSRTIIVRLADEEKALDFVAAIRDEWGIDPLMHTAFVEDTVPADQRELEHVTALFMSSPEFRERVRQMHGCLGELGACDFHVPMT